MQFQFLKESLVAARESPISQRPRRVIASIHSHYTLRHRDDLGLRAHAYHTRMIQHTDELVLRRWRTRHACAAGCRTHPNDWFGSIGYALTFILSMDLFYFFYSFVVVR